MTSKELNLKLIKQIPEIKKRYLDEVSWQEHDETGSHIVFGDVLVPYIFDKANENNIQILKRIFDTIETFLCFEDDYVTEVITLSVLESLFYKKDLCAKIIKYMGPNTQKTFLMLSKEISN